MARCRLVPNSRRVNKRPPSVSSHRRVNKRPPTVLSSRRVNKRPVSPPLDGTTADNSLILHSMPRLPCLSLHIFNKAFKSKVFQGLSNPAARSLGRDHLKEALERHRSTIMRSNAKDMAIMWMADPDHHWSTIRGYDSAGRMCITMHMRPDAVDDEIWTYDHALRDKWQAKEERHPSSQKAAVIFRRGAYTKLCGL
ncbi:hypothetical protein HGRIS_000695 [Hohenbuehelia grisea]|uniref:Uncharacterized protein n=1 Tax=Hohenbuehelia grisea TaxID=104357 RepID=A0ABR3JTP8_9AGAR